MLQRRKRPGDRRVATRGWPPPTRSQVAWKWNGQIDLVFGGPLRQGFMAASFIRRAQQFNFFTASTELRSLLLCILRECVPGMAVGNTNVVTAAEDPVLKKLLS